MTAPFGSIAPGVPYGFTNSPAYMGDGSTGGAQPNAPGGGILAALQPFLARLQQQQAQGMAMAPKVAPPGAPAPGPTGGGPVTPASPNGFRPGILSNLLAGDNGKGIIPNFLTSLMGGGDTPGQPLNILPPAPTP